MDVSRRIQNATLILSAADNLLLPSAAPGAFTTTCHVSLSGSHVANSSDCSVFGDADVQKIRCSVSSGAGSVCFRVVIQIALPSNAATLSAQQSTMGFIAISSTNQHSFSVSAAVSFQRAPRLLSAQFSSGFGEIDLVFDQPTNSPSLPCSKLIASSFVLGALPSCGWSSQETLTIVLGNGATILSGDIIVLNVPVSDSSQAFLPLSGQSAIVTSPPQPLLPRVTLSGPDSVNLCDTVDITASAGMAQGATFVWGCASDTHLNALLRNQTTGSLLKVNGSLLIVGQTYLISVQAQNRFGIQSNVAVRSLVRATLPAALLSIVISPPPYYRSQSILLEAFTTWSACASPAASVSVTTYVWTVVAIFANGTHSQPVLEWEGPALTIKAGTLAAGAQYSVIVTMLLFGQVCFQSLSHPFLEVFLLSYQCYLIRLLYELDQIF